MKQVVFAIGFTALLVSISTTAHAQGVWIEAAEEGQGILRARGNECFVITAYHVVKDTAGEITVVGAQSARTTAEFVRSFPPDLAVLRVKDARSLRCDEWLPLENFDAMLKTQAAGLLMTVERNGSRTRLALTFPRLDEERVYVSPAEPTRQISQTMSGAELIVNGALAGILLQKDAAGLGEVYQVD